MRMERAVRLFSLLVIFILCAIPALFGQSSRNPGNTFYLGTHLCRFPMPELSEMLADMEILKKQGFNLIKIQTHWIIDEPLEGQYDFSRYEKLIQRAGELGMDVYIGFTCEQAPMWLFEKYPACRLVGRKGIPMIYETHSTLHADGKPGPCFDHPDAMAKQVEYTKAMVKALGKYKNIAVWNVWQEIGYWSERVIGDKVCFCDNTVNHFRRWLQQKYGSLDELNRVWKSNFQDWKYVGPNRQNPIALPEDIDFGEFMDNEQIGQTLRARVQAIKETDTYKRPVFAHKGAAAIASGQDWTYAGILDFLGSSCYPAWFPFQEWDDQLPRRVKGITKYQGLLGEMWNSLAMNFDYIRSVNREGRPVWAAEFQGGPVSSAFHKGRVPSPDDIRRWMLTAVSSGVTTISFWVTRAEIMAQEVNGFSLLDSEGTTTPRLEEAGRVGRALMQYPDLFARPSRPKAEVGIVVNERNMQFCSSYAGLNQHLAYSTRGWHRLLWESGIPVDFVDVTDIGKKPAQQYRALILPFPMSISEEFASRLDAYVRDGGNLVSEAAPGRVDENGLSTRGELSPKLRELFGVRQRSISLVREPGDNVRWMPAERTWGEFLDATALEGTGIMRGQRVTANYYLETFEPSGSEPILVYNGAAAGVVRKAGKGTAWLLGTYIGHNGTAYRNEQTWRFVRELVRQCGVHRQAQGELVLQKRIGADREAWILTNLTDHDVVETIALPNGASVADLLGGVVPLSNDQARITVKSLDVAVLIVGRPRL